MKQRQGTILTGKRSKINIRWEIDCADSPNIMVAKWGSMNATITYSIFYFQNSCLLFDEMLCNLTVSNCAS